jgi:hypothetical protein
MDLSVLTTPGAVLAAGLGAGIALTLVIAFMVVWRVRSPREEQRIAGAPLAYTRLDHLHHDTPAADHDHRAATPLEDAHMEPGHPSGTFATVVNCIDGRAQSPVSNWIKINCQASFVDTITTPGPDKLLSSGPHSKVDHVRDAVAVSVNAHKSGAVVVAGHFDCAANPVSDNEHKRQIHDAVEVVRSWGLPVRIVGLWVNEWWQVEVELDEPARIAS